MKNMLSVVIITKNEERNIERCLKSVRWAPEIVVVDSGSVDTTVDICRQFNCHVVETRWLGFGPTKRKAVESASHDWVLSIDADEEVSETLRDTIEAILQKPEYDGYRIKRQSFYLGKKVRYSGWEKDYPLRLFNRNCGQFDDSMVHESVHMNGTTGKIDEPIIHYPYPDVATHFRKMNLYTELGAETLRQQGRRSSPLTAVSMGMLKFVKMFLLKKGFLDGRIGYILALNSAFGVYLKYLKLWEKNR
jgi:glycosyltransferase involved in cell wall biosynthesis